MFELAITNAPALGRRPATLPPHDISQSQNLIGPGRFEDPGSHGDGGLAFESIDQEQETQGQGALGDHAVRAK